MTRSLNDGCELINMYAGHHGAPPCLKLPQNLFLGKFL